MEKCQGCGVGDTDTAVTLVELTEWLWIYTVPPHPLPGEPFSSFAEVSLPC